MSASIFDIHRLIHFIHDLMGEKSVLCNILWLVFVLLRYAMITTSNAMSMNEANDTTRYTIPLVYVHIFIKHMYSNRS